MRHKPLLLHAVWVGLAVTLLTPWASVQGQNCAGGGAPRPDEGGIGGTGVVEQRPRDEGGIGGTGVRGQVESAEGGVVGSGVSARNQIGVIGTITGFASICVGELEIHYDASTPIEIDGIQTTVAALAVGQVVEVVASEIGKGPDAELRAQRIDSHHLVAGPISHLDPSTNTMTVLGQPVHVVASTRLEANAEAAPFALAEGGQVRVSGMRRADGVIIASRISPLEENAPVRVSGSVAKVDGNRFEVSGVPVRVEGSTAPALGGQVRVVGAWDGASLQAQLVEPLSRLPFAGRVERVEVEGFARRSSPDTVNVGGFEVHVPKQVGERGSSDLDSVGTRVRVQATLHERRLVAERIEPVREARPGAMERGPIVPGSTGGSQRQEPSRRQGAQAADNGGEKKRLEGSVRGSEGMGQDREGSTGETGGAARIAPAMERQAERRQGERPLAERPQVEAPPQIERPMAERPLSDRPQVERPPMERPQRPDLPQRPQPPALPERPPRPERPQAPEARPR